MYESLLLPWSSLSSPPLPTASASAAETAYRAAGLLRTKGTIFCLPPPLSVLTVTYNSPPRPRTRMSAGAVALCKHFERRGGGGGDAASSSTSSSSSDFGRAHAYWERPVGSNDDKTAIAERALTKMLAETVWRNVMLLHKGVAVYEIRNARGWGMRWTLEVVPVREDEEEDEKEQEGKRGGANEVSDDNARAEGDEDLENSSWRIVNTTFRGFVEPIEGMDHEIDGAAID